MAKNFAELSAKLGNLMVREEIPAIEVEGRLITREKDRLGNDMAVLRTVDEKFWASLGQAQDNVIFDLLAKGRER